MSLLSVSQKYIATARSLQIDVFDYNTHKIINIPAPAKPETNDCITDLTLSSDNTFLAAVTSNSKQLVVYSLPLTDDCKVFTLPRSASKIRFSVKNTHLFVADKTGDVLIYNINDIEDTGTKLMGYLSLLLDIQQTKDEKFIITCERDEKIRVSCYPNTYNIQNYCLGHKEFVNHIEFLPHCEKYLVSTSGDGTVKIWDYENGKICNTINTSTEVDNSTLNSFVTVMDEDEVEVQALPIVHFTATKLTNTSSLIAVSLYSYNTLLIYCITNEGNDFTYKLVNKIQMDTFPASIQFCETHFYVYDGMSTVNIYNVKNINESVSLELERTETVFNKDTSNENRDSTTQSNTSKHLNAIKVLYKRKFDNVQEYQERKKQRLAKSGQN